jgi:hypothetical protein
MSYGPETNRSFAAGSKFEGRGVKRESSVWSTATELTSCIEFHFEYWD